MNIIKIVLRVFACIILVVSCVLIYFFTTNSLLDPVDVNDNKDYQIVIIDQLPSEIFQELEEKNIIKDSRTVSEYFESINSSIYPGTFNVQKSMTGQEIVAKLSQIPTSINNFTISEGQNVEDAADSISKMSDFTTDEIIAFWDDKTNLDMYIKDYSFLTDEILNDKIKYPLEGYLTPATYPIDSADSLDQITRSILDHSATVFAPFVNSPAPNGFTLHEALTFASIVERETIKVEDKYLVSGVFYNRLNSSDYGKFESDITVLYAKGEHKEQVLYTDLEFDSPYNTYMYDGLPPGPIANPSTESINATYDPEDNNYFFFFAAEDGMVYYSETLQEHEEISKKYEWNFND